MSDVDALLRAVVARPGEAGQTWLVLADLLEERGDPRHELIRLQHQPSYRPDLDARGRQARAVELLVGGMRPCVPEWTNAVGLRFVWCPPGTFLMGSPDGESMRDGDEGPQHAVTLTRGFWVSDTPPTRAQWRAAAGDARPAQDADDQRPADNTSWNDCVAFCDRLARLDGRPYRLPTEAEWEYACRAGTTTRYFFGDVLTPDLANYDGKHSDDGGPTGTYHERSVPVRSYPPNWWGLYEMHGNVAEWVADGLGAYTAGPATDPPPAPGDLKVLRGGSWFLYPWNCRSANRNSGGGPEIAAGNAGCRVCFHET